MTPLLEGTRGESASLWEKANQNPQILDLVELLSKAMLESPTDKETVETRAGLDCFFVSFPIDA